MSKIYVLDTNVLLHDPNGIYKFEDNHIVIPIYVIEEIDRFKKEASERGRNARTIARLIDELREKSGGSLQNGVKLDDGGSIRVAVADQPFEVAAMDNAQMDHAIVRTALDVKEKNPDKQTIFVTMDTNLRIRADALGLRAENYEGGRIVVNQLYSGQDSIETEAEIVNQLGKKESVPWEDKEERLHPNVCVTVQDNASKNHVALGVFDAKQKALRPLRLSKEGVWSVRPRNKEQSFAMDLLLDESINLVTLVGKAGTGKTLLAVAAGLQKVVDEGTYARLLVSRPIFPLGRDIGYLPGDLEEKLNPWMQPVFDNLEYIFASGNGRSGRNYAELVASGMIEVEPLTYIRGRSLPNQYLIVDEAQNLTPHEVKTIITRCGNNTKIVLTGDPDQIDNPYVDSASNGLTIVAERFKHEMISGHIILVKGERSELAERATQLL